MKILFLDDMPQRWHKFTESMPEEHLNGCYYAETYDEAISLINKHGVDYFSHYFLDHDLSDHHYGSDNLLEEKNGTMFAEWMVENGVKADVVVCHSMNPVGRKNQQGIILRGRITNNVHDAPFGWAEPEKYL